MPVSLELLKETVSGWIVKQKQTKSTQKAPYRWVAGLVVGVVSLVTLALLAWQARRKGRELAKLKHERDRLKHEEIRSRMAAEALKDKVLIDKHIEVYKALKEEISLLAVKVAEIDQQEQEALEKIDAIKNWEEVDSYLGSDRMPSARDRDSPGTP